MRNIVKKLSSLVMALVMLVGVFASTSSVFAEDGNLKYLVDSNLTAKISGLNSKVSGTVDISKTVSNKPLELQEGTTNKYKGEVSGSVEAGDLFEGAYTLYKDKLYDKKSFSGYWRNIVMFGSTKDSFPTCSYTVRFPENITVDRDKVTATKNTSTISKIETDIKDHSVTFTFYLGNWNDYEGFFKLVESERNKTGKTIDISIPYTVDADESSPSMLGSIKGSGECNLYKFGFLSIKTPIVSITSPEISLDVLNPRG
ncbi:hypothetical protein LI068_07015 [Peptostreptococcus anaerobius]|uniref:hypothetical protein n=1 Tax=Peptostreptococcus anaerobius TaxID=1261 RepID=UPI001D092907|nr:hypothetical protein [Peptostreptococcus anaerobius]MCB6983371.1 hypothetical protein [Peptostreptococcus anaerobius]MCQ5151294.1 hypothetical protein [Peptostreptococcus anaerobius]